MTRILERTGEMGALVANEGLSGSTLAGGALSVGTALTVGLLVDVTRLTPGWADPLNLALTACAFLGPVACGVAAWRAIVLRRDGMLGLADTTPRGRGTVLLTVAAATWMWTLVSYLVLVVLLVLGTGVDGGGTPPMSMLAVQAISLLFFLAVLGTTVGSRVTGARMPPALVPPLLALGTFTVLEVLDLQQGALGRLSPLYAGTVYRYRFEPNLMLLVATTTALVGASLAVVAAATVGRGSRTVRVGRLLVVVMTLAGSAVALTAAPPGETRLRAGGEGSCRAARGVELCVWPGPDRPVSQSIAALSGARRVAASVIPVPTRFFEPGLDAKPGARAFDIPTRGASGTGAAALFAVIPPACDAATEQAADDLTGLVAQRLTPGSVDTQGPWAAGIPVADQSLADQRAWAARRVRQLAKCD